MDRLTLRERYLRLQQHAEQLRRRPAYMTEDQLVDDLFDALWSTLLTLELATDR
jgi:hypothetical protein